jgi:hypothetical protein
MLQRCQTEAARSVGALILTLLIGLSFYMSAPFSYGQHVPMALSSALKPLGFGAFMAMYAKFERSEDLILSPQFFMEVVDESGSRVWPSPPVELRFRDRFLYFGSRFRKLPETYWRTFCNRRSEGILGAGQTLNIHWRQFATEKPGAERRLFAEGLIAQCSRAL